MGSAEAEADGTPDNPVDLEGSLAQARKTLHKAEQHHARIQATVAQRAAEMRAAQVSAERAREIHARAEQALTAAQAAHEQAHRLATAAQSQQRQAHALADALAAEAETWKNCLDEIAHSMSKTAEQRAETYTEEQDLATAHQAALALISRAETELARLETRRETLAERSRLLTQLPLDEILQHTPQPRRKRRRLRTHRDHSNTACRHRTRTRKARQNQPARPRRIRSTHRTTHLPARTNR